MYSRILHWSVARFPNPKALIFYMWLQCANTGGQLQTLKCQEGSGKVSGHPTAGGQVQPGRLTSSRSQCQPHQTLVPCPSLPGFTLHFLPLSEVSALHAPEDKNWWHLKAKQLPPPGILNYFTLMGRVNRIWNRQKYFVLYISSPISKILKKPKTFTRFLYSIKPTKCLKKSGQKYENIHTYMKVWEAEAELSALSLKRWLSNVNNSAVSTTEIVEWIANETYTKSSTLARLRFTLLKMVEFYLKRKPASVWN